jgi:hypothetical protein
VTPEQSKDLKIGTRVCFNGVRSDGGTVTASQARYLTIKWDDGHESFTGHNEMKRIDLAQSARKPPNKRKRELDGLQGF